MKGQSSVEFTIVVGLALILSSPFILASQSSVIELRDATRFLDLDQSLKEVRRKTVELEKSTFPARRTVDFRTPEGVEEIYNINLSDGSALVFEIQARGRDVNRSIIVDTDLNLTERGEIGEEGIHEVSLRRTKNGVNMSVIS